MVSQVFKGISYVQDGFHLIKLRGVKRFVIIPVLINFILFSAAIWYGYIKFDTLLERFLPSWLEFFEGAIWFLFAIICLLVVLFAFTLIANLFGAPFNGVLSEKIEERISNEKIESPATKKEAYIEMLRGARIGLSNEFRKIFYIAARAIPLLILFIIPGINVFAPFLWFLFGSWMLAIEYLDYPMGNRNMSFKEQLTLIKNNRFLCLGMGGALMFMTIVPGLNFFAMPVGVAAATALWTDQIKPNKSSLTTT